MPRAPAFPASLQVVITPPSSAAVNVLILFHGLGDTSKAFSKVAAAIRLPETICITLQAPSPLPFDLGGFHWGDDIVFDSSSSKMEMDTGFTKSAKLVTEDALRSVLLGECGFKHRDIILFGFGQGAMAALAAARNLGEELGGIVSIGGPIPSSSMLVNGPKNKTPVLVLGGSSKTAISASAVSAIKATFETVEYHRWQRDGDGMPRNRDEMLPIMQFFSRRLRSRQGVPEGSVEIM